MEVLRPRNRQEYDNLLVLLQEQNGSNNALGIDVCHLSRSDQQDGTSSLFQILTNRAAAPMGTYRPVSYIALDICKMSSEDDLVSDTGSFTLLLQYLHTNTQLQTFRLEATGNDAKRIARIGLLEEVGQAIAASPSINSFSCNVNAHHLTLPATVVSTATNVKTVRIFFEDFKPYSAQRQSMMVNAFWGNRSIQHLSLSFFANDDFVGAMLPAVAANPSLQQLDLGSTVLELSATHFDALAQVFGAATALEKVHFRGYRFHTAAAGRVFDAMSGSAISTWFEFCHMDVPSTDRFVHFVRNIDRNHYVSLGIVGRMSFQDRTIGNVLSEALPGSGLAHATLTNMPRSGLEVDMGGPGLEVDGLFHGLEANYKTVGLSSLDLDRMTAEESRDFASFVPKTTSLRSLQINSFADHVNHRQLVKAFRQNGSLINVTIPALYGSVYETHLEAFKERNEKVPAMLGVAAVTEDDGTVVSHLPHFPPLFCAAQEAPHMAPNNVLIGLLAADEASGLVPMGR